jgi:DNA primase
VAVGITAEIKSRLPVADVVGETVQLRKAGTTLKGLCPFHGEKTPSFVVTPGRDTWHCFGCGKGGDIFSFVMERDGLGFPEARRLLAARAGVEIDDRISREDARRARLHAVVEAAVAFYHAVLMSSKAGEPGLAYLRDRGFTDDTIVKHQLGWAPAGWDQLVTTLAKRRDIGAGELIEVGIARPRQRGGGAYDFFRERVLFPIRDANGHAIGLGGRVLPDAAGDGPKYLHTGATPLFDKSRTLYLVDRAKSAIRKSGQAVIVEGYTDALMAHQAGYENVVASLGTALTPGQVALLIRYGKARGDGRGELSIALAYDVDAAGEKAGTLGAASLEALIRQLARDDSGVELDDVRVVRLPPGKDPDEVLRETPAAWGDAIRDAQPIVDHLIDTHARAHDLRTPGGRARFVEAVLPTIRHLPNPVLRDAYLGRVRQVSGVEEGTLREAARQQAAKEAADPRHNGQSGSDGANRLSVEAILASPDTLRVADILRTITRSEAELLTLTLLRDDAHDRILDEIGPDRLPTQLARELYRAVVLARARDDHGVRPRFDVTALLTTLDPEIRALAEAVLKAADTERYRRLPDREVSVAISQVVLELEEHDLDERARFNHDELAEAERGGDRPSVDRLLRERLLLNEQRRSLDRRRAETRLLAKPAVAGR